MSKPKGPGKRFQKGQSGNPGGRPKIAKHLAEVKHLTGEELKRLISFYFRKNMIEIGEAAVSETLSSIDVIVSRAIQESVKTGDLSKVVPLIDRVGGKVLPQTVDPELPEPLYIIRKSTGEQVILKVTEKDPV